MTNDRILVLGCGGLGGIVAAALLEQGAEVTLVTHNEEIASAICERGLVVRFEDSVRRTPGRATPRIPPDAGTFGFVFLLMQPPQVEEAARTALPHLSADGAMVCFQNGLCEERVARIAGPERTIGAIVAWGASMIAPGVYERTSPGGFVLGTLDGRIDDRLERLRRILGPIGEVHLTRNLTGARWSKLAINCAISSLGTIGGQRLGVLLRYRFARRLALETMTEAVVVARARGVVLEKVAGTIDLEWVALSPDEFRKAGSASLLAKHALLLAVGTRYRRMRSSMLAAIERGRPPAVDFLNGEVVQKGREVGLLAPLNARICDFVHAIARGEMRPSVPLLRRLFAETRREVRAAALSGYREPYVLRSVVR
ncbi:MAG: hypothetical protein KatS3mg076_1093 [Candidatus Binatia bacterium]|nr:MAG: hypothetical protein KatS3mg076_1093 [Candidatus Binatia bacterium]